MNGWPPPDERARVRLMMDGSELPVGARVGDILADKYRIERILGVGGMGIVVAAYHVYLDERVAIKFLLPAALKNSEVVARFAREARAAVKIKSEHVARVTDVGVLASESPYMVMEYLEGCDLSAYLQQHRVLPTEQAVEFVLQACEAIADAHGLGIIHRDLKPANLFCIRRSDGLESIKVLDFGISKVSGVSGSVPDAHLTRTNVVFGSPLYMSPEQMLSCRDVDSRTDIWALGAILYELLTGKSPFDGETLPEVYARISTQPPPPLRDRRPDAPLELEAVILRCLEKDRNSRYSNVAELARSLAPFGPKRARTSVDRISRIIQASGLSVSAVALPPSSDEFGPSTGVSTNAAWGQTTPKSNIGPTGKIAGVVVALLVAGVAATAVSMRFKPSEQQIEPSVNAEAIAGSPPLSSSSSGGRPSAPSVDAEVVTASPVASNATSSSTPAKSIASPKSGHAPVIVQQLAPSAGPAVTPIKPAASASSQPSKPSNDDDDILRRQF